VQCLNSKAPTVQNPMIRHTEQSGITTARATGWASANENVMAPSGELSDTKWNHVTVFPSP